MTLPALPAGLDPLSASLSPDECRAVLERITFGHLAFSRRGQVDAVPIQFSLLDGWLYFRADARLRAHIAHHPWMLVAITDRLTDTHIASIVVRGTCYVAENTGTHAGDAAALRGIVRLRDPGPATADGKRAPFRPRTVSVFRMHVVELHGSRSRLPRAFPVATSAKTRAADTLPPAMHARDTAATERGVTLEPARRADGDQIDSERADDDGMVIPPKASVGDAAKRA